MSSTDEPYASAWSGTVPDLLDALGVEWVVAGAVAAMRYRATARFTTDVDYLIGWDDALPDALAAAGLAHRVISDAGEPPHLVMIRGGDPVDLIVAVTDYQRLAIERGLGAHVLTVEDVIIHKLIGWRPRDRDDIEVILSADVTVDQAYVEHWSQEWDVLDRWRSALARKA